MSFDRAPSREQPSGDIRSMFSRKMLLVDVQRLAHVAALDLVALDAGTATNSAAPFNGNCASFLARSARSGKRTPPKSKPP